VIVLHVIAVMSSEGVDDKIIDAPTVIRADAKPAVNVFVALDAEETRGDTAVEDDFVPPVVKVVGKGDEIANNESKRAA